MENDDRPFNPDWYSPTGHTVKTCLWERKWSKAYFANLMGETEEWVGDLFDGYAPVTEEVAAKLEQHLGGTKKFWLAREARFRADKKRITGSD